MGAETYFDGQNTYMYMTDINEVNISGPEMLDEEDSLNPATVFSIFEHGHRYLHAGETTINGKTVDIVDLFPRSEEHTSELQSRPHLVCRLLLEKKKNNK